MQMRSLAAKYCVGNNYGKTKSLDNAVNTDLKHSAFKHLQSIITANVISRACRRKKIFILQSALVSLQWTNSILMLCK